jgi:hypothetical protein
MVALALREVRQFAAFRRHSHSHRPTPVFSAHGLSVTLASPDFRRPFFDPRLAPASYFFDRLG